LLATVPTLAGFRERWLDPEQRHDVKVLALVFGDMPKGWDLP